ncbi:MAG TPA: hypothetical protein DIU15_08035 [Deltaproteobacteria bacterium]|nr:hypothetical protein [Deltaproteobacteria bacterium]HCP45974.1 hypothetical protein [Deltaproteobacteria bacterium]
MALCAGTGCIQGQPNTDGAGGTAGGGGDQEAAAPPQSIELAELRSLDVQSNLGSVVVRGLANAESISIRAVQAGEGELGEALTSGYSVQIYDSRVVVVVGEAADLEGPGIDLFVDAPDFLETLVRADQGSIEVESMQGGGHLETGTGAVVGTGLVGDFSITVDTGEISVAASLLLWGGIDATTGEGPISLSIPASTSAQVEASTSAGSVSFVDLDFVGANSGAQASGLLGAGEGSIELLSGLGDITLVGVP